MTNEEAATFIAGELKRVMSDFIGKPFDRDKMVATVSRTLDSLCEKHGLVPEDDELKALTDLTVPLFVGMPESFDPKALVARISDGYLQRMAYGEIANNPSFPYGILAAEWMKRQGNIKDWSFTQHSAQDGTLHIDVLEPVKFVEINFEI